MRDATSTRVQWSRRDGPHGYEDYAAAIVGSGAVAEAAGGAAVPAAASSSVFGLLRGRPRFAGGLFFFASSAASSSGVRIFRGRPLPRFAGGADASPVEVPTVATTLSAATAGAGTLGSATGGATVSPEAISGFFLDGRPRLLCGLCPDSGSWSSASSPSESTPL